MGQSSSAPSAKQRASFVTCCCCPRTPQSSTNNFSIPVKLASPIPPPINAAAAVLPLILPAPNLSLINNSSSPSSSSVDPIYARAVYLYTRPISHLSWQRHENSGRTYYYNAFTSQSTWKKPDSNSRTTIHSTDFQLRPTIQWFPQLLTLTQQLNIKLIIQEQTIDDPYYHTAITTSNSTHSALSMPCLCYAIPHLIEALSIYPPHLLKQLSLHTIVLVDRLYYQKTERLVIPVVQSGYLYISTQIKERVFLLSLLHHELFHWIDYTMINNNILNNNLNDNVDENSDDDELNDRRRNICDYDDIEWLSCNSIDISYNNAGGSAAINRFPHMSQSGSIGSHSIPAGFLNLYSLSAIEEDKAEIWAGMMRDTTAILYSHSDSIIQKKATLLKQRILQLSPDCNEEWWKKVAAHSFAINSQQHQQTQHNTNTDGTAQTQIEWQSIRDEADREYWWNPNTQQAIVINNRK